MKTWSLALICSLNLSWILYFECNSKFYLIISNLRFLFRPTWSGLLFPIFMLAYVSLALEFFPLMYALVVGILDPEVLAYISRIFEKVNEFASVIYIYELHVQHDYIVSTENFNILVMLFDRTPSNLFS